MGSSHRTLYPNIYLPIKSIELNLSLNFIFQIVKIKRWLLIECKREFAFEDSLTALEVMWATINTTSTCTNNFNKLMSSPSPSPSMQSLSFLNNSNNNNNNANNKSMSTSNINDEAVTCKSSTSPFQIGRCLGGEILSSYKSISNASSISMRILRQIDPTYSNNINNASNVNGNFNFFV